MFCKKIYLYLVFEKDNQDSLVTILDDKKQISEYINRRILIDNYEHYLMWCDLRKLDFKNSENELLYINTLLDSNEEVLSKYTYIVKKVYYKRDKIASILRMFNKCVPLGCSYENAFELPYIKEYIEFIKNKEDKKDESK